jgi:hypothetical protein
LLLLLYAGVYLHCQPLPVRADGAAGVGGNRQEQRRGTLCQKKLQTVQAATQAEQAHQAQAKLLPLDLCLGSDFAALYFGLLFPAHQPTLNPARGPNARPAQVFANHPNKAPPVRFS